MDSISLSALFDSHKEELAEKLKTFSLPRDSKEVQITVSDFLNSMFENDGAYRQSLTQSEDYILQAALSMLNAQRAMVSAFDCQPEITIISAEEKTEVRKIPVADSQLKTSTTFIGVAGGAIAGRLLLGGWGAVFGALAGTAVALYLSLNSKPIGNTKLLETVKAEPKIEIKDISVNVPALISVIAQICESLDNLIDTFRSQIKRVVNKYESTPKVTLEGDFLILLENIQSLLGAYEMDQFNENRTKRIDQRIQLLEESLENYNLQSINYDGSNDDLFVFQPSPNVEETTMVLPAITKDGKVIIKGKIFTKE